MPKRLCHITNQRQKKIEFLHGHKWKGFLDVCKGYLKIFTHKGDKEKTFFHTDEGTVCYKKIPFGLKNTRAAYQRLVDKIFESQIGKNI